MKRLPFFHTTQQHTTEELVAFLGLQQGPSLSV